MCTNGYPHVCKRGLEVMAVHMAKDVRNACRLYQEEHGVISDLDEVAIHMRCGDVIGLKHHKEYGYMGMSAYKTLIPADVRSIGIITAGKGRNKDTKYLGKCTALMRGFRTLLMNAYPAASVTVRNNDTIMQSYARLALAPKATVCNPSTFCLYPTIANGKRGYFAESPLYPWVAHIESGNMLRGYKRVTPADIVSKRMTGGQIAEWMGNN